jgi:hypothetical protein
VDNLEKNLQIFQTTTPRYKKMRTHGKRLLENGQKISDNVSAAAPLIEILVYIVELFSVQIIL